MDLRFGFWGISLLVLWVHVGAEGKKVCIVGSGIGGSSTAKFLREMDDNLELEVFEMRSEIGGRMKTVSFDGLQDPVNAGASIMHKGNRYLFQFIQELGLDILPPHGGQWAIYDGHEFVFVSSSSEAIDAGKLFWKYGYSLMRMKNIVKEFTEAVDQIYDLQSQGVTFASPVELLQKLGLHDLTQTSLAEMMVEKEVTPNLINEMMAAVNRVNYGQNCTLSAFAGMVGLVGSGADLRAVKGGFQQINVELLKLAKAEVRLNTKIEDISRNDQDGFTLTGTPNVKEKCDAVVIAAPLEQSELTLPSTAPSVVRREFHLTETTFIRGTLKPSYFWNKPSVPAVIYTTETDKLPFNSIGCYSPENQTNAFYKIFSREPLTDEFVKKAFDDAEILKIIPWRAYPHFKPPSQFSPFLLEDGLIYINSMESAASAMEISAIGGKNAALLVHQYLNPAHPAEPTKEDERVEL